MTETIYQPINITWTQQGAESFNWVIPAEAVAAITAYIATQTKMEPVPMTDPDGHPYINYASAPKVRRSWRLHHPDVDDVRHPAGSWRIPAPPRLLHCKTPPKAKAAEAEAAKQAALSSVLVARVVPGRTHPALSRPIDSRFEVNPRMTSAPVTSFDAAYSAYREFIGWSSTPVHRKRGQRTAHEDNKDDRSRRLPFPLSRSRGCKTTDSRRVGGYRFLDHRRRFGGLMVDQPLAQSRPIDRSRN